MTGPLNRNRNATIVNLSPRPAMHPDVMGGRLARPRGVREEDWRLVEGESEDVGWEQENS
jgi:hypothetical protein